MVPIPFSAAARVRPVLAALDPDAPVPIELRFVVQRLAAGTAFEGWFVNREPGGRELIVLCGQLAAARPGAGLFDAFTNLAEDCCSDKNAPCPDKVVSVYEALASAVPKFGPAPQLRQYLRSPGLFFPGLQEISGLAAAAAGLLELGAWDEPDPSSY